jgi:hypothetical protein
MSFDTDAEHPDLEASLADCARAVIIRNVVQYGRVAGLSTLELLRVRGDFLDSKYMASIKTSDDTGLIISNGISLLNSRNDGRCPGAFLKVKAVCLVCLYQKSNTINTV